jgi:hypothetical protein
MGLSDFIGIIKTAEELDCTENEVMQSIFEKKLKCYGYKPGGTISKLNLSAGTMEFYVVPDASTLTILENPGRLAYSFDDDGVMVESGQHQYKPTDLQFNYDEVIKLKNGKLKQTQRHVFQPNERKSKAKSALQFAIEAYLDTAPDGNKAGFYTFLKAKIKLTTEEILKDGEGYDIFFKSVTESGSKEGVYLNGKKEGKREGKAGYNHYSGSDISSNISREKGKRKKMID